MFAAALWAGATSASAQTGDAVSLIKSAPAALRLRITNPAALTGRVQVVRLSTGQTLFTETYSAPAYGHRFDFSHVPSGRYLVWLQAGGNFHRCIVRVQTWGHSSAIRVAKLTSRTMPTLVSVGSSQAVPSVAGL
jgi:hypothetical protein